MRGRSGAPNASGSGSGSEFIEQHAQAELVAMVQAFDKVCVSTRWSNQQSP
jgi:hypothetical protein